MNERCATLGDGRALAYAEFGDPSGKPVFYFHGFPGCRLSPVTNIDQAEGSHHDSVAALFSSEG